MNPPASSGPRRIRVRGKFAHKRNCGRELRRELSEMPGSFRKMSGFVEHGVATQLPIEHYVERRIESIDSC